MAEALLNSEVRDKILRIELAGDWLLTNHPPSAESVLSQLDRRPGPMAIVFDTRKLGDWDTGLITTLIPILRRAANYRVRFDEKELPQGAQRLIALAFAVKEREGARRHTRYKPFLERLGESVLDTWDHAQQLLAFAGELVLSFGRFSRGQATYLREDLIQHIQDAGAKASWICCIRSSRR